MTTTTAGKTTTARATPSPKSPASASRLASSIKFKTFAVAFGVAFPLMYVACEWWNLPLFTFHPATNRVDVWWAPGRSGEGPAMYWYGWTVTSLLVGSVVGLLATLLPESVTRKLPLFLVWLLPVLGFIPLAYSLMPFWTK
jgi:hypothetical protein